MKFALSSLFVLAFASQSALAFTLYRNGGASKAYNTVRTPKDYDTPVNNIVPANPNKGMSTNTNRNALPSPNKNVWQIDSASLTTDNLKPVQDGTSTHYFITLTAATNIDDLLNDINNAGWSKIA